MRDELLTRRPHSGRDSGMDVLKTELGRRRNARFTARTLRVTIDSGTPHSNGRGRHISVAAAVDLPGLWKAGWRALAWCAGGRGRAQSSAPGAATPAPLATRRSRPSAQVRSPQDNGRGSGQGGEHLLRVLPEGGRGPARGVCGGAELDRRRDEAVVEARGRSKLDLRGGVGGGWAGSSDGGNRFPNSNGSGKGCVKELPEADPRPAGQNSDDGRRS
eukprot:gene11637-biopygen4720